MLPNKRHPLLLLLSLFVIAAAVPACNPIVTGGGGGDPQDPNPGLPSPTVPPATASAGWERYNFTVAEPINSGCHGDKWVTVSQTYGKWVGAVLCSADRYKLVMGENKEGLFYELADDAGHGQDHCELVNPEFTIPNEDDITSGGCVECEIGSNDPAAGSGAFVRSSFGEAFSFRQRWRCRAARHGPVRIDRCAPRRVRREHAANMLTDG